MEKKDLASLERSIYDAEARARRKMSRFIVYYACNNVMCVKRVLFFSLAGGNCTVI